MHWINIFTVMFKLDRTAFKKQSFEEADRSISYGKDLAISERLRQSFYLTALVYRFDINNPPKMDKMHFEARK